METESKTILKPLLILIFILTVIIASPFCFIYFLNNGNPYTKYVANKLVPVHLKEKGYTKEEIEAAIYVEPKYVINRNFYHGHYMVVFKDEPDLSYYYGVTKKGNHVKQFCEKEKQLPDFSTETVESRTIHSENKCVKSQDNRF
ncbi:DUF3139 domain-containing protein [Fictibacillus barbaricus]|uniref:DUF3139 domain-containing protein n=1 Tax=Fictibacillus barbaricus TaxID=182136 RepID=A0ABU1TV25_9BACL|nr:DUF3139 domain-containing protein [Fictibacillus barbaricus]MDR7071059.1 hypothetical protein [Fictibacillus barbaricus]